MTKHSGVERQRQSLSRIRVTVTRDVNQLLAAIEREADARRLLVGFSSKGLFTQLNGLHLKIVCAECSKKNDPATNMRFLIIRRIPTMHRVSK